MDAETINGFVPKNADEDKRNEIENLKSVPSLKWEEVSSNIEWGVIRGKKIGHGRRKILAVHGWLDNANSFDLVVPYFYEDCTIITIDMPGHGLSDHFSPGFIYDVKSYVGAIKKFVISIGWDKFTYLGHSMGAVVGIIYSAVFSEDIDSFLSIDIIKPWSLKPENQAASLKKYFLSYFKNEEISKKSPLEYDEDDLIQMIIEGSKSLDSESANILLGRSSKLSSCGKKRILTRDLRAKAYFIGFLSSEAWFEFAKAIKCPILIIKGKDGHRYESAEEYDKMLNAFQSECSLYQYHEIEGMHHLHLTNSKCVGPIIKNFLDLTKVLVNYD